MEIEVDRVDIGAGGVVKGDGTGLSKDGASNGSRLITQRDGTRPEANLGTIDRMFGPKESPFTPQSISVALVRLDRALTGIISALEKDASENSSRAHLTDVVHAEIICHGLLQRLPKDAPGEEMRALANLSNELRDLGVALRKSDGPAVQDAALSARSAMGIVLALAKREERLAADNVRNEPETTTFSQFRLADLFDGAVRQKYNEIQDKRYAENVKLGALESIMQSRKESANSRPSFFDPDMLAAANAVLNEELK